jgi:hypothetical protein
LTRWQVWDATNLLWSEVDALRRARKLPVGPERNDLRQLATGLLWLHRNGMDALVEGRRETITTLSGAISAGIRD